MYDVDCACILAADAVCSTPGVVDLLESGTCSLSDLTNALPRLLANNSAKHFFNNNIGQTKVMLSKLEWGTKIKKENTM